MLGIGNAGYWYWWVRGCIVWILVLWELGIGTGIVIGIGMSVMSRR